MVIQVDSSARLRIVMVDNAIDPSEARYVRQKYSAVPQNDSERILDGIETIVDKYLFENAGLHSVLNEAAMLIHRRLEFKEVAIGLRDSDGKFRYKVLQGFTSSSESARRAIAYTDADMASDSEKFPSVAIGRSSEFLNGDTLAEEFGIYNRPSQLQKKRVSPEEFKEGDYIDNFIFGKDKEMIGWIEVSGSKDGKLPSRTALFWLEMIGSVLGLLLTKEIERSGAQRKK